MTRSQGSRAASRRTAGCARAAGRWRQVCSPACGATALALCMTGSQASGAASRRTAGCARAVV
eukprot:3549422-Prymnesium_polylepis.1